MKAFLTLALVAVLIPNLYGQQDPLYAQYFNNPILINPAFTGNTERLLAAFAYRSQWAGLEGRPVTFSFNAHMPLAENKIGAGFVMSQDKIGEFKTTQSGALFSYKIGFKTSMLSFGMQAGLIQYAANSENVNVLNPDPLFADFSTLKFNTGAGILLKNDKYSIGLSVPHLLPNAIQQGNEKIRIYHQNYYAYGSYNVLVTDRIVFKPSALLRLTRGAPISADLNLNVTFNRFYTGGLFSRNLNTYGLLLQFVIKDMRFGYVYELPGGNSELNYNTHEIGLTVSLAVLSSHDSINNGL
jgi:type IX secretion system PorP/SprF family membrane protein